MAHLWIQTRSHEWTVQSLDGEAWILTAHAGDPLHVTPVRQDVTPATTLRRSCNEGATETWVLCTPVQSGARVNGERAFLGLRVLQDRDDINIPGVGQCYFSTEQLAQIVSFPGTTAQRLFCPRCKQLLGEQSLAVQCPRCQTWHHQSDEFPCWLYAPHCTMCEQTTALTATYSWTPEEC